MIWFMYPSNVYNMQSSNLNKTNLDVKNRLTLWMTFYGVDEDMKSLKLSESSIKINPKACPWSKWNDSTVYGPKR